MRPLALRAVLHAAAWLAMAPLAEAQVAPPPERGQIRVNSTPPAAIVLCDGREAGSTPVNIEGLLPGRHLIVVRKEGFREVRRTVELQDGDRQSVDARLEPLLGLVLVHSTPPGAEVELNNAFKGQTPLLMYDVPRGQHRLRVTSRGYKPMELDLTVEGRTPQRVTADLVSDSARLQVTSEPPGARVTLGGVDRGTTPCAIDRIPSGRIVLDITHAGYRSHNQVLTLHAGEEVPLHVTLAALPGELIVVTIPDRARVYVGGQFRGVAPYTLRNAEPGEYELRVESVGYRPATRTATVRQAQSTTTEFRLERDSGLLELTTEPAGVTVFLDGKQVGVTEPGASDAISEPLRVDLLSVGAHTLQLTRKGYFEMKGAVEIRNDETLTMHQKLKRRFIPDTIVEVRGMGKPSYRGVVAKKLPNGDIEFEELEGVFVTLPAQNIVRLIPLMTTPQE